MELQHHTCRICGDSGEHPVYTAREMMFGLKEEFSYFQCAKCQCLQISEFPSDMSHYYPQDYYSLSQSPESLYPNPIESWARRNRDRYAVLKKGVWGRLVSLLHPAELDMACLSHMKLNRKSRIVDVGCGTGFLLYFLKEAGFENVSGVEPHIDADINYANGLVIKKDHVHELSEEQDIIMFHHSFEHLPDPIETLEVVRRLLPPGGICMLRIPLVSSEAWKKYGTHWVQLDAPRHFFLYSIESLNILAEKTKFKIKEIVYDSDEFQFWGSQQYLKDIPLMAENSYGRNPAKSIFSSEEIEGYKKMADKLNADSQGDQAAIYMVKT
ncbi:MAG: class I SAM-dependent methyltransferase [Nitrospinae bacterium]|nr:class I SAM-dependent methyltransferase [Nitrospinota bacterium]MBL7021419.1 class I SAM-dependent methyltransferase [Nitrospinaceae bacterium]